MTQKSERTAIRVYQTAVKGSPRWPFGIKSTGKQRGRRSGIPAFVSYSHADERLRGELGKHLTVLERQGLISIFYDRMISAGSEWKGQLDARLEQARLILLLVSSDFISSPYCYDVEMKRAIERHMAGAALVIPVVLRPVALQGMLFAKLQVLPRDARPATTWPDLDSAFVDVTEGLREAVQGLR